MEPGQSVQVTAAAHAGYQQCGINVFTAAFQNIGIPRIFVADVMPSPLTERGSAKIAPQIDA
jgi:hypothetical protein